MSSAYYRIYSDIWLEPWDEPTRYAAFYLLTNDHRTLEGLYRLPTQYAAADLKWPVGKFEKCFGILRVHGFIEWDEANEVVLVVNALKRQAPNANQAKRALKFLKKLPDTPLLGRLYQLACEHSEALAGEMREAYGEGFLKALGEPFPKSFGEAFGEGLQNGVAEPC
jgi:hypothetical protein